MSKRRTKDQISPVGATAFEFDISPGGDGILKWVECKQGADGSPFTDSTPIANFTPVLVERRAVHTGFDTVEELVFNAFRAGRYSGEVILTKADITGLRPDLKFPADCRYYSGKGNREWLIEFMLKECEDKPLVDIYEHTGYIVKDGERVFVNGLNSITCKGFTKDYIVRLPEDLAGYRFLEIQDSESEIFNTLLIRYPAAVPAHLYYTLVSMAFLSPLNTILGEVGHTPRFIPAIIGRTGSFKTTIANLNLNFFGVFSYNDRAPISFDDTENAVGIKLSLLDGVLASLDDRLPPTTQDIKRKTEKIEQAAARMIGDRRGRGRVTSDIKLRDSFIAKGNLATTAEEMYSNTGESGVARYISIEIKQGDISVEKLVEVQNRAYHLNNAMSLYIQWVLQNWEDITSHIKGQFIDLRNKAQSGGHFRLAEAVAHLQIGIIYFSEWLISDKQITPEQAEQMQSKSWKIFLNLAAKQEHRIVEENPIEMFIAGLREMLARKTVRVVDIATCESGLTGLSEKLIGYRDNGFFYLYPDATYSAIRAHYAALDKQFPLSKQTLLQRLSDEKLIETSERQTTKQKRIPSVKNPVRLIWLKADAVDEEGVAENE